MRFCNLVDIVFFHALQKPFCKLCNISCFNLIDYFILFNTTTS